MSKFLSGSALEGLAPGLDFAVYSLGLIFVLVLALWFVRRLAGGTFIAGGIHRHRRLAILDAAAVDTKRRLVLVRRDDREHLLLIGGATDIVVERNIHHEAEDTAKSAKAAADTDQDDDMRSAQVSAQPTSPKHEESAAPAAPASGQAIAAPQKAPAAARPADTVPQTPSGIQKPASTPLGQSRGTQEELRTAQTAPQQPAVAERPERRDVVRPAGTYQRPESGPDITGAKKFEPENAPRAAEETKQISEKPKALDDEMERLLKELSSGR